MMNKLFLVALAGFAVAVPGSAAPLNQEFLLNLSFTQALESVQGRMPIQDPMAIKRALSLRNTLTDMRLTKGVGSMVEKTLREFNARIEFRRQTALSAYGCPPDWVDTHEGCPMTIFISESVPLSPIILTPLIARETAKFMPGVSDMMDSAQRRYMERSIEVRAWLEQGGDQNLLPVLEPSTDYQNAVLAAELKVWLDNEPKTALRLVGEQTNTKDLSVIAAQTRAESAALSPDDPRQEMLSGILDDVKVADKRFKDFLEQEATWRRDWRIVFDNDRM